MDKIKGRANIRMEDYRGRVMKAYNKKVWPRNFQVRDLVLRKTNRGGNVGKIDAKWEGLFKVI